MTPTFLYDWEVQSCGLPEQPNLTGCYSVREALDYLRSEFPQWYVELQPEGRKFANIMRSEPGAEPLLVLVEKS